MSKLTVEKKEPTTDLKQGIQENRLAEARKHLVKDTWTTEWLPVLSNAVMLLGAVYAIVLFVLNIRNTDFSLLLCAAALLPIVLAATSMILPKIGGISRIITAFVYLFSFGVFFFYPLAADQLISIPNLIGLIVGIAAFALMLWNGVYVCVKKHDLASRSDAVIVLNNFLKSYKTFGRAFGYWWMRHPKIAEFIRFFLVANLVTVIQFIMVPVLQMILKNTGLVDIDFHLFGPIGGDGANRVDCTVHHVSPFSQSPSL